MICSDCPPDPVVHPVLGFPKGATVYERPDFDTRSGRLFVARGERVVVLRREGTFALVRVPTAKGSTVRRWVNARDGVRVRTHYSLLVRRKQRDMLVFRDGRRISRMRVTVGKASTPTPRGVYTVTQRISFTPRDREYATYGKHVLALDITTFAPFGGQTWGNIALHRNFGGDLGRAASHGCIRVPRERLERLYRRLPAGSLVKVI